MKSGATLGFGGAAVRALRLLGVSELGQVPRGLTPLLAEVSKGSQLLQQMLQECWRILHYDLVMLLSCSAGSEC
ncbi:hypothetical protein WJX79_010894 [Trebouxia sp. C0005]